MIRMLCHKSMSNSLQRPLLLTNRSLLEFVGDALYGVTVAG